MKNESPLVSIIVPTRNRFSLLCEAVSSVNAQSYDNIELVIVDDCSDSPIVCTDFNCENIKVIVVRNDKPSGGAISRNVGFEESTGELICFLDDDDYYHKDKIKILVEKMDSLMCDVVFGRIKKVDKFEGSYFLSDEQCNGEPQLVSSFNYIKKLHTNSSLIKRPCFDVIRFNEDLQKYQDVQVSLELIQNFKVYFIPVVVAFWRQSTEYKRITDMHNKAHVIKTLSAYEALSSYILEKYPKERDLIQHVTSTRLRITIKCALIYKVKSENISTYIKGNLFQSALYCLYYIFMRKS